MKIPEISIIINNKNFQLNIGGWVLCWPASQSSTLIPWAAHLATYYCWCHFYLPEVCLAQVCSEPLKNSADSMVHVLLDDPCMGLFQQTACHNSDSYTWGYHGGVSNESWAYCSGLWHTHKMCTWKVFHL